MSDHLASIGMFVFGMDTTSYQQLDRRADWKWPGTARYGARDALQFTGPGGDEITLTGTLVPEIEGSYSDIEKLREMGDSGETYPLLLGDGTVMGQFAIGELDDSWQNILQGGRARKIDFSVVLHRVADDQSPQAA